ncbi:hypothetical protein GDO78_018169 [Eleutherodactylus coqui]|uniref:ATR interacting protein n=1 Tax=Eleutherodactylus coqui TaxID=57060 RepID=A0A8J6EJX6_ELECQ|nr:hypothetical protein GDO78_018169 [Eleutherodactylus coqui]
MSINLLLAAKKRDLSALYPVNRFNDSSHPAVYQCVHSSCCDQGKYPPSKRYCSVNITESKAMEDSFADGEEFTAEDLEEIDIIASQAYTQDPGTPNSRTNHVQSNVIDDDNSATDVLRAQHEDLKQKLKVLQDEIILRNGEIKVLRDVLRQTESSLEQQRIAHAVLEKEKTQMQCEKNKETLKKIQSLQSELEFKDAEMIELKTKLQSCEQRTVLTQISPKKSCSVTVKLESCPSPQPGKLSFPTKESFRANTSFKAHVPVSPLHMHLSVKSGSVLLSTLMQQSEPLGTPGLYHLLSSNLGGLPVSSIQRDQSNNTTGTSSSSVVSSPQCAALKDCQKLAISGLNAIALGEEGMEKKGAQCQRGTEHLVKMCRLSGALRILPLVEYHITAYYQALQSLEKSEVGSSENSSMSASGSTMANAEDTISRFTDPALASLEILYHLVFHSLDVVETLLQRSTAGMTLSETERESNTVINRDLENNEQILHPLIEKIVLLLSPTLVTLKRDIVREQVLCVLVKLAENSSKNCLLLALYTYIISRPDKQASEKLWLQLEHEVVRFLNKLITYGWSSPSVSSEATCLCNREVVKALVLALHHEWLSVRRLTILLPTPNHNKSVLFLKEAVMVLHSLYQKDKSFSEHCLEVFHQYDQAVPGVRALFRKFNTLNENEEFALDELCPPEVETEHENMDCT